jgi:tetratricopeptide (TPR) repeat protein
MATRTIGKRIDDLIDRERWDQARALIEKALAKEPESHWLLTQLGSTCYEQKRYKKALEVLLRSRDIVPDCPLTLWHLANTLDALGDPRAAIRLYTWLVRSAKTAEDDPCWESNEWANALKTDCVYRLGLCFIHLGRAERAADCFRKYLALLAAGSQGSYSFEETQRQLQHLPTSSAAVLQELQETADWVLRTSGDKNGADTGPPQLDRRRLRHLQGA